MSVSILFVIPLLAFDVATTRLEPQTTQAFEKYVKSREAEMQGRGRFLWCDGKQACHSTVKQSDVMVDSRNSKGVYEVPGGLIHDWQGATFVPGVTLDETLALLRNYDNHKQVYAPEVIDSKLVSRQGEHNKVYLRLRKKKIITVILNTEYDTVFERVDATHGRSRSLSTRITEVADADSKDEHELPPGEDHGFMWRLNSYWRFEERDGGVYIECEAISLSRGVPALLSSLMAPILRQLPRESLEKTLLSTRRALMGR
ncbi:MAG: hypothetical protein K2X03_10875 [Bryobacteraceae bacterium]|nr:hypothetical protein [Bryobacteraceae bacterium]